MILLVRSAGAAHTPAPGVDVYLSSTLDTGRPRRQEDATRAPRRTSTGRHAPEPPIGCWTTDAGAGSPAAGADMPRAGRAETPPTLRGRLLSRTEETRRYGKA